MELLRDFKRCVILSGAPTFYSPGLEPTDYIIACDHGYDHARQEGIVPHLIVGDFDSVTGEMEPDVPVLTVPAEKDDTDTMLAVRQGLSKGFSDFLLLGATGGRLDHQMANFSVAAFIAGEGGTCIILDERHVIYTLKNGSLSLERRDGWCVSVLSYSDESNGVTLQGLKYPLTNATLRSNIPLGVSNEFAAERASVTVQNGLLFVMLVKVQDENG